MSIGETKAVLEGSSRVPLESVPEPLDEAARQKRLGRVGALLFGVASLTAMAMRPLVEEPAHLPWYLALGALGLSAAVVCWLVPWHRVPRYWFHVLVALGLVVISILVIRAGDSGDVFRVMYIYTPLFSAFAFHSHRTIAAHTGMACAAWAISSALAGSHQDSLASAVMGVPILVAVAIVVAYLREHMEANEEAYRRLSLLDPLTGLGNYRTLHNRLEYEIERHARHDRSFAVLLLDIDDFKQVNERFGHPEGDRVLKQVAGELIAVTRGEDTVSRQGGDEFSILVPECTNAAARALLERVVRMMRQIEVGGTPLEVSVGYAIFPDHGARAEALLAVADEYQRTRKRLTEPELTAAFAGMSLPR